ncbi:MAG: MAGE family-domain-containing protein [Monoraphidium minutum]|nr:MAG: MAGE family-domain-containing protein [Monoraphidium minutum]
MNAKIQQYQSEGADAEAKLAALLSAHEYDALVARVVRCMLFKAHEKPGVPVKRQELLDACFADYRGHGASKKLPSLVLRVAQARAAAVFGLEMEELSRVAVTTKRKGVGADDAPNVTSTYVLRSILPVAMRRALVDDPADDQAQGFKALVLALIHLNGGQIEADDLWRHLSRLGADRGDKEHPHLGKTEDALAALEKTRHIVRSEASSVNGPMATLRWGENAASEFGEAGIKQFIEQEFAAAPGFDGLDAARGRGGGDGNDGDA